METFRICYNIAGAADPRIVPEEIFAADLERCINPPDWPFCFSNKSLFYHLLPADVFPKPYLHNIGGTFFDPERRPLDPSLLTSWAHSLDYPLVLKPNIESSGGRNVFFPDSPERLLELIRGRQNFIVQEALRQHPFFAAYHDYGVNTIRVYTYKSVRSHRIHVLNAALRMGVGGSLDNVTAGGIVCFIHPDGRLHHFACDRYGRKFERHPDSGLPFGPQRRIPAFDRLLALVTDLAARLPMIRLTGWDMCLDQHERWRCIEANLMSHSIRFAQYAGQPFFGPHTEEVIEHWLHHPRRRRATLRIY